MTDLIIPTTVHATPSAEPAWWTATCDGCGMTATSRVGPYEARRDLRRDHGPRCEHLAAVFDSEWDAALACFADLDHDAFMDWLDNYDETTLSRITFERLVQDYFDAITSKDGACWTVTVPAGVLLYDETR